MNQLWSPADRYRSWARTEIFARQRSKLPDRGVLRRPYDVTWPQRRMDDSTVATESHQPIDDDPAHRQQQDEIHPERPRMRTEAVLLLAKTPLSPRKLAQMALLSDATQARSLIRQLNQTYQELGRAIRIEQVAGGYRLMTRPALAPWLDRLGHLPEIVRISGPMMETLAVVAYRQPVSRANAEAIRGVACGELLRQLMERDLIRIVGRGEELGRPYLYGTTKRFLQLFGLPRIDDLPPIQWQALTEAETDEDSPDDFSTSTKEQVVSTTIAPTIDEAVRDKTTSSELAGPHGLAVLTPPGDDSDQAVVAIDDDDDDDWDDDDDEELEDDWDDEEDWDDDDEDDEAEDDDFIDEDDDEDLDEEEIDEELDEEDEEDLDDDDWEEVDDDDEWEDDEEDDEEWDEEEDDEEADDDEDWE